MPTHEAIDAPVAHDFSYVKEETLLEIHKVGLRFGDRWVLKDVSAKVQNITRPGLQQGQVVCFLGPSGIGKTRLARLIAGLDTPTEGRIRLAGDMPTCAGLVGLVAQSYPLFNFMTVKENLWVAAKQGGGTAANISGYFQRLGLAPAVLDLYPQQLSGGQRQRVAIIRQLLCSEHVVIMDEPFSGLDIKAKQQACQLITQVAQLDTYNTIIVITHDVTEGMSVADTVWLMGVEAGRPGAHIVEEFDLAARELAWRPDIMDHPLFQEMVLHVKHRFLEVTP